MRDYRAWHRDYDDPGSSLAQRLRVVQQRLGERLSAASSGQIRLVSICAGQGRDVVPVLAQHSRGGEVDAVLLEIDPQNATVARESAAQHRLSDVTVVQADASSSDAYAPYVPADIVLACGVFGNISDADLEGTIRHLSMLCRAGASVIWTRHWKDPLVISRIQQWFAESAFWNLSYDALDNEGRSGVGVALLQGQPLPFKADHHFFTFLR